MRNYTRKRSPPAPPRAEGETKLDKEKRVVSMADYQKKTLKNGLRLISVPLKGTQSVTVQISVASGVAIKKLALSR